MPRPPRLRRSHRSGFIIFFGWRMIRYRDGKPIVQLRCPKCREEANIAGMMRRPYFHFFWIPIYPLAPAEPFCQCCNCKAELAMSLDRIRQKAAGGNVDWQSTIEGYNRLRDAPTDSALLLELLEAYEAMGEWNEAISTAKHFPEALEANAPCLTALARCLIQAGHPAEAVPHLQRAETLSPGTPETSFQLARAYAKCDPPRKQDALAALKRAAKHPDAKKLTAEINKLAG